MIRLDSCVIEYTPDGCTTYFPDGAAVDACPHPGMPHYHIIAHRCGYQDDVLAYCREHEFAHAFVSERIMGTVSHVLWTLAHKETQNRGAVLYEEMAAQQFQRWLRANERPIVSGADWDGLKREALDLLNG